eukprot:1647445-Rhodomonas_salina.1
MAALQVQRAPPHDRGGMPDSMEMHSKQCLTIGRDPRSDVVLSWDGASRAHAWLDLLVTTMLYHC